MACSRETVSQFLQHAAPLELAENWDNVGWILDPEDREHFESALLTIDLTQAVLKEAVAGSVDLLIAYHPPIFSGLKRLRASSPQERVILAAARAGLSIYSPHTALDAAPDGMTEWLARAAGPGRMKPIVESAPGSHSGSGRQVRLDRPVTLGRAVEMVKVHLGLENLRVSEADRSEPINTVGVCPGAGGSVFEKLTRVDLLLTGEMRHHDVLAYSAAGTHVLLTEHTNSERGYLPHLARQMRAACPGLAVQVSAADRDPLAVG